MPGLDANAGGRLVRVGPLYCFARSRRPDSQTLRPGSRRAGAHVLRGAVSDLPAGDGPTPRPGPVRAPSAWVAAQAPGKAAPLPRLSTWRPHSLPRCSHRRHWHLTPRAEWRRPAYRSKRPASVRSSCPGLERPYGDLPSSCGPACRGRRSAEPTTLPARWHPLRRFSVRFGLGPRIAGVSRRVRAVSPSGRIPRPALKWPGTQTPRPGADADAARQPRRRCPSPDLGECPLSIPRILEAFSSKRGRYV